MQGGMGDLRSRADLEREDLIKFLRRPVRIQGLFSVAFMGPTWPPSRLLKGVVKGAKLLRTSEPKSTLAELGSANNSAFFFR